MSIRLICKICVLKQERADLLKCQSHGRKIHKNNFDWQSAIRSDFATKVRNSGLSNLFDSSFNIANKYLVNAFVERWMPETNTFHMTFGEMTITLDDVSTILGIPVVGKTIELPSSQFEKETFVTSKKLLAGALGITEEYAWDELKTVRGSSVRLEWLRPFFDNVKNTDGAERIGYAVRAYLLFLLGCTLFTDKSGTRVPVSYLHLLMDVDQVHTYAWGAGALAYLYRQLGVATRASTKQMAGYLTLLEAWIHEHFLIQRPPPDSTMM